MQETINFLSVLDINKRKSVTINHSTLKPKQSQNINQGMNESHVNQGSNSHRKNKFPFFKALNFVEEKF
jgi:hypothetical protein